MPRIPSYLHLNRYGIYHFRIRLSRHLIEHLGRTEFNRSLRTSNRRKAIHLAQSIKFKLDIIFRTILDRDMNIKEARQLLDKVAGDIIQGYRNRLEDEEPDDIGMELAEHDELADTAEWFLDLKQQGYTEYTDENGQEHKFEGLATVPDIKKYTDWIIYITT